MTTLASDVHRVLRLGDRGDDVAAVQDAANRRLHRRELGRYACAVDGDLGHESLVACEKSIWALGALLQTVHATLSEHELSIGAQDLIRNPDKYRTASQLTIAHARAHELITHEHHAATSGVHIDGNTVTGGTPRERVIAAAVHSMYLYETGKSHRFYSQPGAWDVTHEITGPTPGHRDDCSLWFIGMHHSAGVPDPAKTGYAYGNTATLWAAGHEISEAEAEPADGIIYSTNGAASGSHHIEMLYKPRPVTIGHGDAAINRGTAHEMTGAHFFRFLD